jgi:hypothetical protein
LKIGGLNRRLKENAAESQWFVPQAEPFGRAKLDFDHFLNQELIFDQ